MTVLCCHITSNTELLISKMEKYHILTHVLIYYEWLFFVNIDYCYIVFVLLLIMMWLR